MKRLIATLCLLITGPTAFAFTSNPKPASHIVLRAGETRMTIATDGFRFGFFKQSKLIVAPHPKSGILVDGSEPTEWSATRCLESECTFKAKTASGSEVTLSVSLAPHHCAIKITPATLGTRVVVRTAGLSPAYGLGDRGAIEHRDNTELTGLVDDHLLSGRDFSRLASNFVIFPQQGMAEVLPWPGIKIVHLTDDENAQGVESADKPIVVHYFFGTPHEIYAEFAQMRRAVGDPLLMPKYEMFGVGWEAFGALGWRTNDRTDRDSIDHYLALGYPIKWAVIGSGFWPAEPASMHETTSFGFWDTTRYPDPRGLIQYLHDKGLKVLLGLRITFITTGPFADEGVKKGYFIEENGTPKVFKTGWPELPCYLLNAQSPEAVNWYLNLVQKWKDYGVDGFKEDFYGFGKYVLRDDKVDPINEKLMALGYDLIERNGYLASNGDLQRINDFNFNQDQDRGPVNALALAYSGLPLVYPDIVGGTFGEQHFDTHETEAMDHYMMRNAMWAALHSSMSMGQPPWLFKDAQVGEVLLKAAQLHERLHPYLYSQAVRFVHDGYPWTMTPLPIAYSEEPGSYGRENRNTRGYEWMIGDALLAAPLYGDDYATANSRDIYLPRGKWMDYDTGRVIIGPTLAKNYSLQLDKIPLFVGGTGIVFENNGGAVVVRIYPIAKSARTEFWSRDGKTQSMVELKVRDWEHLKVTDTTAHRPVPWTKSHFAAEFKLTPGHAYLVE